MAKITEMDQGAWDEWVKTRPKIVQDLCEQFPPDRLYQLYGTGHRVTIHSYSEDGTMTVIVSGEYNLVTFERRVFDIKPEEITECDLPTNDELLGSCLTKKKDIEKFIEFVKEKIEQP